MKPKKVLITGGSGLVGRRLTHILHQQGVDVVWYSRKAGMYHGTPSFVWNPDLGKADPMALEGVDAIVHLAGESVAGKPWSKQRKESIYNSRVKGTQCLVNLLKNHKHGVKTVVSASAIGYYGAGTDRVFEETDKAGSGFLPKVCIDWEAAADQFPDDIRMVKIRIGIVLSLEGGALYEMYKPLKKGVASILGDGKQIYSWIHLDDLCRLFMHALDHEDWHGVYNGVAPQAVDQKTIMGCLKSTVGGISIWAPAPAFVLRLMLGEMAEVVLGSANVSAKKALAGGFQFLFPEVPSAIDDLWHKHRN